MFIEHLSKKVYKHLFIPVIKKTSVNINKNVDIVEIYFKLEPLTLAATKRS